MNIYGELKQLAGKTVRGVAISDEGQLVLFFSEGFQLIVSGEYRLNLYELQAVGQVTNAPV